MSREQEERGKKKGEGGRKRKEEKEKGKKEKKKRRERKKRESGSRWDLRRRSGACDGFGGTRRTRNEENREMRQ